MAEKFNFMNEQVTVNPTQTAGSTNVVGSRGTEFATVTPAGVNSPVSGSQGTAPLALDTSAYRADQTKLGQDIITSSAKVPQLVYPTSLDLTGMQTQREDVNKLYEDRRSSLDKRREEEVKAINASFDQAETNTRTAQTNETGTSTRNLLMMGGSLGSSASEQGALLQLERSHRDEMNALVAKRQAAIQMAQNAYDDKSFALAQAQIKSVQDIDNEIYKRQQDFIDNTLSYMSESRQQQQTWMEMEKFQREQRKSEMQASREGAILGLIDQGVTDPGQILNYLNYNDKGEMVGDMTLGDVATVVKSLHEAQINPKKYDTIGGPNEGLYQVIKDENTGEVLEIRQLMAPDPTKDIQWSVQEINGGKYRLGFDKNGEVVSATPLDSLFGETTQEPIGGVIPSRKLTTEEKKIINNIDAGNKLVDQLEQLYFGAVGTAQRGVGGPGGKALESIFGGITRTTGLSQGWNTYRDQVESNASVIAKGLKGVVGAASDRDVDSALKSFPDWNDTYAEAKAKFDNIRRQLDDQASVYGKTLKSIEQEIINGGGNFNETGGMSQQQVQQFNTKIQTSYPSGFKGGQCGTFAHKIVDFPSVGDGKLEKFKTVDRIGIKKDQWLSQGPKIGDVVITNENPTYGHVAVVNRILPDGRIQLTESNFKQSETVSHDRIIDPKSSKVYGAIRGKPKFVS